jgi:hypothetical protein
LGEDLNSSVQQLEADLRTHAEHAAKLDVDETFFSQTAPTSR